MIEQNQWRSSCLAITAISINIVTIYALINPNVGNRSVADFEFPQEIEFNSGKAFISSDSADVTKASPSPAEIVKASQSYRYTQGKSPIDLEISYLANTRGGVEAYLQKYTKIEPEAIQSEEIVQMDNIGYHALLTSGDRAYLSSCISPRSPSSVTPRQFSQYRYQNDLNLRVGWEWLQGKASIRDRRCLWVHLSTPLVSDSQTAYKTLEATWREIYQWWLPNFPAIGTHHSPNQ